MSKGIWRKLMDTQKENFLHREGAHTNQKAKKIILFTDLIPSNFELWRAIGSMD